MTTPHTQMNNTQQEKTFPSLPTSSSTYSLKDVGYNKLSFFNFCFEMVMDSQKGVK